jgi:hypothetical protein
MPLIKHLALSALLAGSVIVTTPISALAQDTATPPAGSQSNGMPSGMMGQGGATSDDMMQMMTMMRSMMPMMNAASGMMSSHVEDRISALKAELKPNDTQTQQWNRFAEASRGASQSMSNMYRQMAQSQGAPDLPKGLDAYEKLLGRHLAALTAVKDALAPLYSTLSDAQKKAIDGFMIGPMGMM